MASRPADFRGSPLPLFVARILAHDKDDAAAADDLALVADATDAGANLHACVRGDGRLRLQRDEGDSTESPQI